MDSPRLTAKSFAEILRRPTEKATKVMHDQKYPKEEPQIHRIPYYQTAITAIKNYYRADNNVQLLDAARNRALSIPNQSRRVNTLRVLDDFQDSPHSERRFLVKPAQRHSAAIGRVEVRLSADMQATEAGKQRIVYFHCSATPIDEETAILLLEIAHWILAENHIETLPEQVEVLDVSSRKSHHVKSWRKSMSSVLTARARAVSSIWDSI